MQSSRARTLACSVVMEGGGILRSCPHYGSPMSSEAGEPTAAARGRFTSDIVFALPARAEVIQDLMDLESWPDFAELGWVDVDAARVVEEDRAGTLKLAEAGRGGSGLVIALNVLAVVGAVRTAVDGVEMAIHTAKFVKGVWQKLRNTDRGLISLSCGAAGFLALACAAMRDGSRGVEMLTVGAVDPDTESSYSEQDLYWAIISVSGTDRLEFYMISDKGDVTYVGGADRPPHPWDRQSGSAEEA
jgi:hypothetical protein